MAAKIYATESSVYRTVGLFEERMGSLNEEERKDGGKVAASIAEYAIECSLNKFFGTEVLDYVVDEGLQLHGGYGFMEEYEISRLYQDSRINRIFEGTNEINRLLVPATYLRKGVKGELPLFEKAQALQEEMMMTRAVEAGEGLLNQEENLVKNGKKIALLILGLIAQKYGKKAAEEQEILANAADIISEVYAMESVLLRTQKAVRATGEEKNQLKVRYTEIFCQEAFQKIEHHAKETLSYVEEGDSLRMMLSALRKFTKYIPKNMIAKKREVAEVLIEQEEFVV
jgi:hypothetical protein